jgi:hypothetical protein
MGLGWNRQFWVVQRSKWVPKNWSGKTVYHCIMYNSQRYNQRKRVSQKIDGECGGDIVGERGCTSWHGGSIFQIIKFKEYIPTHKFTTFTSPLDEEKRSSILIYTMLRLVKSRTLQNEVAVDDSVRFDRDYRLVKQKLFN